MSPVNRTGSVSEISSHHSFLCKKYQCVHNSARLGWPGYRDLGFCDRDFGNRDENFPIWTLQPGDRGETFLTKTASLSQHRGQNGIILVLYFHFRSSFTVKVTRVHKAVTVANNTSLCSNILVVYLEFTSVDRAEFPIWTHHRIRPDNRASPVTGLIWRGPKAGHYLSPVKGSQTCRWSPL